MVFRKLHRAAAGVIAAAALVGMAARSDAASVSIQEVDKNGNAVGAASVATEVAPGLFTASSTNFASIVLTVNPNAGEPGATSSSLSTTYNIRTATGVNLGNMPGLAITVKADGFTLGGGSAGIVTNTVGASSGIGLGGGMLGVNRVGAFTMLQDGMANVPGSMTAGAVAENPGGYTGDTTSNPPMLPSMYSITQLISITAKPPTGQMTATANSATFSGTISSTVDPNPVPAPAGLVLALSAIPALGLRRALRKKTPA
jgi:hypothetical protein